MQSKKYKIGYTTGIFDLFHIGHLNLLKNAKSICEHLIVGVTSDQIVFELKGKDSVIPFEERSQIVGAIKYVDQVIEQKNIDELKDYETLNFDVIIKGSDWRGTDKWKSLQEQFVRKGIDVEFFPYTGLISSTIISNRLHTVNNLSFVK